MMGPMDVFMRQDPEEVVNLRHKGKTVQTTINNHIKKEERKLVIQKIARWMYQAGIAFNAVKLRSFHVAVEAIGQYGAGLKPPSYHEVREPLLKKEVETTKELLSIYQAGWKKYGCTIISDGWSDRKTRGLIYFLVNCPDGTFFLKSIDASDKINDAKFLFEELDKIIQEIGEEHVVQVVTDNASAYVKAGRMLMEKRRQLFWSPCAAHCLDLMLEDISKKPYATLVFAKGRAITSFIYRHKRLLCLMRKKTNGRELVRAGVTRFATAFLTLQSLYTQKQNLRALFVSEEWNHSVWARKPLGKRIADIILCNQFWKGVRNCLRAAQPLVQVLRLVDGDEKPPMGYIYAAIQHAKENIKILMDNQEKGYEPVFAIVDRRWEEQLHQPLHAAGFFLNPNVYFPEREKSEARVGKFEMGFITCVERMVRNVELQDKIFTQIDAYKNCRDLFGKESAIRLRAKKQPIEWWDMFGCNTPDLRQIALRILGLTCSSSACERNWSTFEQVHSKKRNRLEQNRLNDLVFVQFNQRLRERFLTRQANPHAYDPISFDEVDEYSEWLTGLDPEQQFVYDGDVTWSEVNSSTRESDSLGTSRRTKQNAIRDKGKGISIEEETDATQPPESEELEEPEWINFDETDEEDVYIDLDEEDGKGDKGDGLAGASLLNVDLEFVPLDNLYFD